MSHSSTSAIIMKMKTLRDTFTKSEQRVIDTIISSPQNIIYASIAELAKHSNVSEPTVMRTCKKLGLNGYQDLKITLARELVNPMQYLNENISPDDDTFAVTAKVFQSITQTLNFTRENLNIPDIEKAADSILNAKKVIILGVGNSHAISLDFQHKLMRLGMNANAYSDPHMATIAISFLEPKDVVFCISHSGSSREIVDLAVQASQQNATIISLTNIGISPLSKIADIALHTFSDETKYRIIGLNSRIAQLAIIDTIYTLLGFHFTDTEFLQIENAMKSHKY